MVMCAKLGQELPGLAKAPFPGKVGELIFKNISQQAWDMWQKDVQVKVLNEYRLNLGDPKDYQVMVEQMLAFLNLSDKEVLEVENAERGKS